MATFRTSQCQDGDDVLNVMNEDIKAFLKRHFETKHKKERMKKDSNRCFVRKF